MICYVQETATKIPNNSEMMKFSKAARMLIFWDWSAFVAQGAGMV